jgi:hypothetical protein
LGFCSLKNVAVTVAHFFEFKREFTANLEIAACVRDIVRNKWIAFVFYRRANNANPLPRSFHFLIATQLVLLVFFKKTTRSALLKFMFGV